ncbi:MAG: short-chain fatty acid transporter [Firmicutes bacterium]|nr:short-chain fatty acid transporter [Bacillota bacterium]
MKKFTAGCVNVMSKWLPDAFIFAVILTIIVFIAAMPAAGANPLQMAMAWGSGVWGLLAFSMQMALVVVTGTAFATAPVVKKVLNAIAKLAKTPAQGVALVVLVSGIANFLNWGFGLIVGALLGRAVARQLKNVDYRMLIAAGYSGFVIWHAGMSGSIPLALNTAANLNPETGMANTGGAVTELISTSETIFAPWNLIMVAGVVILTAVLFAISHPKPEDTFVVDPALLEDVEREYPKAVTPAEKIENSPILSWIVGICGLVWIVVNFFVKIEVNGTMFGKGLNGLDLNSVNFIFLILGLLGHGTPIRYVHAVIDAAKGAAGVILQFPFYAGIQAMMVFKAGSTGTSLAAVISEFFVSISNHVTFPVWTFLAAGIVNFFVPSGGGQWSVQGPIMMPAGLKLGVKPAVTGMAIAWGDQWTNMIQPFWALPALGAAGLGAKDIMGYCVLTLLVMGVVGVVGFILVGVLGISAI